MYQSHQPSHHPNLGDRLSFSPLPPALLTSITSYIPCGTLSPLPAGTPLLYAVRLGAPSLCSGLIARGASVTDCAMQPSGNGPLHLAALQV